MDQGRLEEQGKDAGGVPSVRFAEEGQDLRQGAWMDVPVGWSSGTGPGAATQVTDDGTGHYAITTVGVRARDGHLERFEEVGPRVKLHLGCGAKKLAGYINVDRAGEPDQRVDLERFPWPWMTNVADEVVMIHVLEHLGGDPEIFRQIVQELYRVCAPGARVKIVVPHPRHDNFLGDPTHVRPITAQLLSLLDRVQCEAWQAGGYSNTPLAIYWGVDFATVRHELVPDEPYQTLVEEKRITPDEMERAIRERNNVISEIHLELEVRK